MSSDLLKSIKNRFRGYLPVVIDVETGGLNPQTDALLEIAAVILTFNEEKNWVPEYTVHEHIIPHNNTVCHKEALAFNKIDPTHPFRYAISEKAALEKLFEAVQNSLKKTHCQRAVLVGHNAWFDLFFLKAATQRNHIKNSPFHAFTSFDTATLGGIFYGQTVLARAVLAAGLPFDPQHAHSAIYDAQRTADFFCHIVNMHKEKMLLK